MRVKLHPKVKVAINILSSLASVVGIYSFFFYKRGPELRYEVLPHERMVQIHEPVPGLHIYYDSANLTGDNLALTTFYIRVRNTGHEAIQVGAYDPAEPLGIRMRYGYIFQIPVISGASDLYFYKNLQIERAGLHHIFFNPVILNEDDFFEIKLVLLHNPGQLPLFESVGKVAGVQDIYVRYVSKKAATLHKAFAGPIGIQLLRMVVYFMAFMAVGKYVLTPVRLYLRERQKKQSLVTAFKASTGYIAHQFEYAIFDVFKCENGLKLLKAKYSLLEDEQAVNEAAARWKKTCDTHEEVLQTAGEKEHGFLCDIPSAAGYSFYYEDGLTNALIRQMIAQGYLYKEGNTLKINKTMQEALRAFIAYVEPQG